MTILAIVIAVVFVIVAVLALRARIPWMSGSDASSGAVRTYVSPFNWECLDHTDSRYRYIVNGKVLSRFGIDVSEHQDEIDWDAVADDGVEFAIIRIGYRGTTEGDLYEDAYYEDNIAGAKAAGIDCGVYFFSQAKTVEEAVEEAEFVLELLDGERLELPVVFDSEVKGDYGTGRTAGLSNDEMAAICNAFCKRIEQGGYGTMVYGNRRDLGRYTIDLIDSSKIWFAEYGMASPTLQADLVIWQYSSDGIVDGIDGTVDLNIDLSRALK